MTRFSLEILERFMVETPPESLGKWLLVSTACRLRARIYVFADIIITCPHSRAAPYFTKRITRFLDLLTPKHDPSASVLPLVKRVVCRPYTKTIPKKAVEPLAHIVKLLAGGETDSPFGSSVLEEFTFAGSYDSYFYFTDFHQIMQEGLILMAQRHGLKAFKIHRIQKLPPSFFNQTMCKDVVLVTHYPVTNADGEDPVRKEDTAGAIITRIKTDFSYPFSNRSFKGLRSVDFIIEAYRGGSPFELETIKEMRMVVHEARNSLEEFHFEFIGESLSALVDEAVVTRPFERLNPFGLVCLKHLATTQNLISLPNPLKVDVSASALIFREYGQFFKNDPCPLETITFETKVIHGGHPWAWYTEQIPESKAERSAESWRLLDRALSSPPFFTPGHQISVNRPPLKIKVLVTIVNSSESEERKVWETKTVEVLKEVLVRMVECHQDNLSFVMNPVDNHLPRGWEY